MLYIIFFEFSLGPLNWLYMSEIMTEKGLSIGAGFNWIATVAIATFTTQIINAAGGGDEGSGRLFLGCGGITVICGLFCLLYLKETKGLSEKEVAELYRKKNTDDTSGATYM